MKRSHSFGSSPTLDLARSMGMVQTISFKVRRRSDESSSSVTTIKNNSPPVTKKELGDAHQCQLDYVIVLDFESTCWETVRGKKNHIPPEIIEFPAVLLNVKTGLIEDQFQQYVIPVEQPRLSAFCTKLTGITQDQVERGVPLKTCLWMFSKWLDKVTKEKNLVLQGNHSDTSGFHYTFVTWSDWDLNICLPNECKRKDIMLPKQLRQWVDLRAIFKDWYGLRPNGLKLSMEAVGLRFEGREHSGLVDAQNTAYLAYKLVQDGAELYLSVCCI